MPAIPVKTDFPRKVREIENTWIEMPDGVRLAARIWLPEDADESPVPAILEYLPYRKRDGTVERDHLTHPYFAGHGYAGVRVDMRGTGDSEGVCKGEYLLQEQNDGIAVIEWLSRQPWCSGALGMIGISWGGFNGLQIAARKPPALKAVISLCSTDDRYADDIHFMGGAVLTDKLSWGATAFAIAHTPPDPAIVGDNWRRMWQQRLEGNDLWMLDWFRNQRRHDFYRHGSICENYADVTIPVYAVGGWVDGYTNPIFRMMEHLPGPRKALIGPWAHKYPHFAEPGPRIGFLQECLRWWDQHLKGIETGIMEEPMIRAWIQDPARPAPHFKERPGKWVAEPQWHTGAQLGQVWHLSPGALTASASAATIAITSSQTAGRYGPAWCSYGVTPDQSLDQSREDALTTVFLSEPLQDDVEILGFPTFEAEVVSDRAGANLIAVLSASDPDGASTLVSFGVLNLAHRNSHSDPQPMIPGQAARVRVQLNAIGQRFARGQRIRLALSTSYWPMVWPAPEQVTLSIQRGTGRLTLPLRPARPEDAALAPFPPAEGAAPLQAEQLGAGVEDRSVTEDLTTGRETYRRYSDTGLTRHLHTGMEVRYISEGLFEINPQDPATATGTCTWFKQYQRGDWSAEVEASVKVEALRDTWAITAWLIARDGGEQIWRRDWHEEIPRDLA